ncbi:hypothetical protein [Bosea sp. BK604]|uniref:hypothetical protein n=1 Tax=Bosea sp. BK604 TaxID=2512180 RepID=UPI001047BCA0|nr:hypothetical protein [Bosea sp. BK604]
MREDFMTLGRTAVIGGMVRDFARRGRGGFGSDVDLVIDATPEAVDSFARERQAERNRFGGYSLTTGSWKIDFWALRSTWGSRHGHASVDSLEDVTKCTFFDCDAVIYDLDARRVFCRDDYLDQIRCKVIEINLLPNPSINGNLIRAIRRMLLWDFEAGPRLTTFITDHLDEERFEQIALVDRELYSDALIARSATASNLKRLLLGREERRGLATFYATQLPLPGVWEPDNARDLKRKKPHQRYFGYTAPIAPALD